MQRMLEKIVIRKEFFLTLLLATIAFLLIIPTLLGTLYIVPIQDDLYHAMEAREYMEQGHGLFSMAFTKTIENYRTTKPFYTSIFLMWFLSGLFQCSTWDIRIFAFLNAAVFYFAIYVLIHNLVVKVMKWEKNQVLPVYVLLIACLQCLIQYVNHEDIYWFCASVGYLTELSFMLFGAALFISAIEKESRKRLAGASVLGILAVGGALNVTAFCCCLYLLITLYAWGGVKRKRRYAAVGMLITLSGALLNAAAPANFARRGEPVTFAAVWDAVCFSLHWVFERILQLKSREYLFLPLLLVLAWLPFRAKGKEDDFSFPLPGLVTIGLLGMSAVIVFPAVLGYGGNVYEILERGHFISDLAMYLFLFLIILYWKGWFDRQFFAKGFREKLQNHKAVIDAVVLFAFVIGFIRSDFGNYPAVIQFRDWAGGEYRRYADACSDVYRQIAESEGDIITLTVPRENLIDSTCLVSPMFTAGEYDYLEEWGNRTIAEFYGKKAVYIFVTYLSDDGELVVESEQHVY